MEERIELMLIDGSTTTLSTMSKARACAIREINDYVKEVHGKVEHDIAWIGEDEAFAVDRMRDKILSPAIYITPIIR